MIFIFRSSVLSTCYSSGAGPPSLKTALPLVKKELYDPGGGGPRNAAANILIRHERDITAVPVNVTDYRLSYAANLSNSQISPGNISSTRVTAVDVSSPYSPNMTTVDDFTTSAEEQGMFCCKRIDKPLGH